ncbi:lipopolysaccharide biosynthesis protein [bacterium]|nr:lipopolysaccharide biosynthesis protein [bacterium]
MNETVLSRNYSIVLKSFLSYLPSRILVILNALLIVPIFAYFLTAQEMSIFQISIGILNFLCTISTDWVAKSVLRFFEKYKNSGELENFLSGIMFLEIITYIFIFALYFIFKNIVAEKFYISQSIFFMVLILVIPCGIRQMFYQFLRIQRKTLLYTVSIIIYQITLLLLFFAFSPFVNHVMSLLTAMAFSVCLIDFIIIFKLKLKENLHFKFDKNILNNVVIYAIPLIITNVCIWLILHFGKFVFQYNKDFVNTAVVGVAWYFVTSVLTPLFSLLLFAVFPIVVRKFEKNYKIKDFMSSVLNSFIILFLPFVCVFLFYSFDIAKLAFKTEYTNLGMLFPFCAVTIFIHEFMKLMNTKYHLKNKTYIETIISLAVAVFCITLYIILIKYYGILGFGISMLSSIFMLLFFNSLVKFKEMNYFIPKKLLRCLFVTVLVSVISYFIIFLLFFKFSNNILTVVKILLFLALYYFIIVRFKKHIFV